MFNFRYCKPPTHALRNEASNIFARRAEGVLVQREVVTFCDWHPAANQCHDNTITLADANLNYVRIWGWLDMGLIEDNVVRFASHSVVQESDGLLIDITPTTAGFRVFPFIRSTITETEYDLAVSDLVRVFGASNCLDHFIEGN